MPERPSISVIIPAHNPGAALLGQLASLSDEAVPDDWEVIVVDNRSTDGWPEAAVNDMRGRLPVRLVSAGERSGAAYARNVGAAAARGSWLLFCDADDTIRPGWVLALSRALTSAGVAAGPVFLTEALNSAAVLEWHGGPAAPASGEPSLPFEYLPAGGSGNLAVTRDAFCAVDGFDERFATAEDLDFCIRVQEAGFPFRFVPDAGVDVRLRASIRSMVVQHYRYGLGAAQLYARHYPEIARRQRLTQELNEIRILLRRTKGVAERASRARLIRDWASKIGRLHGGLKARRLIPIP